MKKLILIFIFTVGFANATPLVVFPKSDNELIAKMNEYQAQPSFQASLSYMYQFGTGRRVEPSSVNARQKLDFLRKFFEGNWSDLKWSQITVQDVHLMKKSLSSMRQSFMKTFKNYKVYPGDYYKLFDRRALLPESMRKLSTDEASLWLASVNCMGAADELIADSLQQSIRSDAGVWVYSITKAEERIQKESKRAGGLCGDNSVTKPYSSSESMLVLLKLGAYAHKNEDRYASFREKLLSMKLSKDSTHSIEFRNGIKKLEVYLLKSKR